MIYWIASAGPLIISWVSSANIIVIAFLMCSGKSFIIRRNRVLDRLAPWGSPSSVSFRDDLRLLLPFLVVTNCSRSDSSDFSNLLLILYQLSSFRRSFLLILSYAF